MTCWTAAAQVQGTAEQREKYSVVTRSFWDNWFVQMGMDMSLQNPYGYNFADVFPNGKSFGLDVALGKRFTPGLGLRAKLNWENGIKLLENGHAAWLAPFDQVGVNREKGGYMAFVGDIQLSLLGLLAGYDDSRRWDVSAYPRAGIVYNFGVAKGAPLLGFGIGSTYRIDRRWAVYADMAYQMTSSGFVGVVKDTGTGSNSNGYFDLNLGVQIDIGGNQGFTKASDADSNERGRVVTNPFWSNWFVQAGLDMSLQNPYGCNFSKVIPKGMSFGLDAAVGKWFTPEVALRAKVNWENGLVKNDRLEWIAPAGRNGENYRKGGYVLMTADVLLNVHHIFFGYDEQRRWQLSAYPRAGLIHNFAIDSASPVVGVGIENTYRLNDRVSLFADVDYQATTSESSAGHTGMGVSSGSNGFFDLSVGVQIDLGSGMHWSR